MYTTKMSLTLKNSVNYQQSDKKKPMNCKKKLEILWTLPNFLNLINNFQNLQMKR